MPWRQFLADENLSVAVVDSEHVLLIDENPGARSEPELVRFVRSTGPIYPSRVPHLGAATRGLLVTPSASEAVVRAAHAAGWDVATDDGTVDVRLTTRHIVHRKAPPQRASRPRGRVPRAQWAVTRVLLAQQHRTTQTDLAALSGVSQPTASRVCNELRTRGFLTIDSTGITVTDWYGLAHWWLANYPGHGGPSSYWFAMEPAVEQVRMAAAALPEAVFSGSAAADLLAPWQRPDRVVVYTKAPALLAQAGFIPVTDPPAASLVIAASADPSVWCNYPMTRTVNSQTILLADPLQIVHDTMTGPESGTRTEAAERLLTILHGPLRPAWERAWKAPADAS